MSRKHDRAFMNGWERAKEAGRQQEAPERPLCMKTPLESAQYWILTLKEVAYSLETRFLSTDDFVPPQVLRDWGRPFSACFSGVQHCSMGVLQSVDKTNQNQKGD